MKGPEKANQEDKAGWWLTAAGGRKADGVQRGMRDHCKEKEMFYHCFIAQICKFTKELLKYTLKWVKCYGRYVMPL